MYNNFKYGFHYTYRTYANIPRIFFPELSKEKLGCAQYLKQDWYCSASKQMIPSRVKEWSANHVLVDYGYKFSLSLIHGEKKLRIIEEAEKLDTVQREESMMWAKVVFVTGAKNKMRLREKNSNHQAFHGQKARHPELEKKGYAITWTIKDNTDAQLLVKCVNWML